LRIDRFIRRAFLNSGDSSFYDQTRFLLEGVKLTLFVVSLLAKIPTILYFFRHQKKRPFIMDFATVWEVPHNIFSAHSRPFSFNLYRCRGLWGLSGMVISRSPSFFYYRQSPKRISNSLGVRIFVFPYLPRTRRSLSPVTR